MTRPLYVHVHIPHTGGTSIRQMLVTRMRTASYSADAVARGLVKHMPAEFIRSASDGNWHAVTGHFKHLLGDEWTPPYLEPQPRVQRLITTVRHPLKRTQLTDPGNLQCGYILDAAPDPTWDSEWGDLAFEYLQRTFWWVGRTEHLTTQWPSLCRAIGLAEEPAQWTNRGGGFERPARMVRENAADLRLYERVVEQGSPLYAQEIS